MEDRQALVCVCEVSYFWWSIARVEERFRGKVWYQNLPWFLNRGWTQMDTDFRRVGEVERAG